jgi:hypothetical protein
VLDVAQDEVIELDIFGFVLEGDGLEASGVNQHTAIMM